MTTPTKKCSACRKIKPIDNFYKSGDRFQSICKLCEKCRSKRRKDYFKKYNKTHKEYRKKYQQEHKDKYRENRNRRKKEIKAFFMSELGGKCQQCGMVVTEDNACIFDFHHIEPIGKSTNERRGIENSYNSKFDIFKVVLLCANCHRLEHYNLMEENENQRQKKKKS